MSDTIKLVTGNRLGDGLAVWLGEEGWVDAVTRARALVTPQEVEAAEATAKAAVEAREVVDLATIDATIENGEIVPVRLREKIRAAGPTVRRDLGYQAHGARRAPSQDTGARPAPEQGTGQNTNAASADTSSRAASRPVQAAE